MNKRRALICLKTIVSAGLLGYLLWIIDWKMAMSAICTGNKILLVIAPLCMLFGLIAAAYRWKTILKDNMIYLPLRKAYKGYLIGNFYSIFLPGAIGGDAVRIAYCVRQTACRVSTASTCVFIERIFGILALCVFINFAFGIFPAIFSKEMLSSWNFPIRLLSSMGLLGMLCMVFGSQYLTKRIPKEAIINPVANFIYTGVVSLTELRWSTLGKTLLLSALFQVFDIIATFLFAEAVGIYLPLPVYFAVIPIVYVATVIPISMGGVGVREGAMAYLLAQFGVDNSLSIMLSFMTYFNRVAVGSIGGMIQLKDLWQRN